MADLLEVGSESVTDFEVDGVLLTDVGGTLDREVLSTPAMIAMMERTASLMVHPLLQPGQATVPSVDGRTVGFGTHERRVVDAGRS